MSKAAMMWVFAFVLPQLAVTDLAAAADPPPAPVAVDPATWGGDPLPSGSLQVLTYNVAGLYDFVSDSTPSINHALMGELFNRYDLVLVQESFHYQARLRSGATHPYTSMARVDLWPIHEGDGLGMFSHLPMEKVQRETWATCSGLFSNYSDCLASKGLTVTTVALALGAVVDVYNLHMDAGDEPEDQAARGMQISQLLQVIHGHSRGRAVIVAGDTNLNVELAADDLTLDRLLDEAGLADACEAEACEGLIDRIFYRSGEGLTLSAAGADLPDDFNDGLGAPLSDHDPVAATLAWRSTAAPPQPQLRLVAAAVGEGAPIDDASGRGLRTLAAATYDLCQEKGHRLIALSHQAAVSTLGGSWLTIGLARTEALRDSLRRGAAAELALSSLNLGPQGKLRQASRPAAGP